MRKKNGNKGEVANSLEDLRIKNLWGEIRSLYAIRQHWLQWKLVLLKSWLYLHRELLQYPAALNSHRQSSRDLAQEHLFHFIDRSFYSYHYFM